MRTTIPGKRPSTEPCVYLKTARLLVRDLAPTDLDPVHTILDIDLSMDGCTRAERARWLGWTIAGYEQHERLHQPPYGEHAVALAGTGEVIGLAGLVPSLMPFGVLPYYRDRSPGDRGAYNVAEVGLFWAVATAHQRNGYATEAAAALMSFGFDTWHLRRVVATTEHANTASIAVMRRLGMRIERNPLPAPFFLQVVGVIDNPATEPAWPTEP
jgi:RimJ/RimL family protein N-acetyltransferase